MCRTCKAENPKWSKGARIPVKELPIFFASQPSWNFEQKIYGHNVVVTERARPTLTGRLGCHDIEGVVHRRQDHFLVREIFHCPGKKYNCSPRDSCTGRRRHCYGLCKVTVYSANKDMAIVQFAGNHGTGTHQRRVWPYSLHENESPPRDLSKKESKMRAIFGSPNKDVWSKMGKMNTSAPGGKQVEQVAAFKGLKRQALRDENVDLNGLNNFYQPRLPNPFYQDHHHQMAAHHHHGAAPPQNSLVSCGMLYPSPPAYDEGVILSPDMSPEERLKQQTQQSPLIACGQISPYSFYPTVSTTPHSPSHNFWNSSGLLMSPATHLPITPPQNVKSEKLGTDYIPTLGELNCTTAEDNVDAAFYGSAGAAATLNGFEPYGKRRKIDSGSGSSAAALSFAAPSNLLSGAGPDLWPHYLHPGSEFGEPVKLEPMDNVPPHSGLYTEQHLLEQQQHQDNYISLMLRADDRPLTDTQPPGSAQLTKL